MEFVFLTQSVYLEILILIGIIVILVSIWWHDVYTWVMQVYMIIQGIYHTSTKKHHTIPHIDSGSVDEHHIVSVNSSHIREENIKNETETQTEEIPEIEEKTIKSTTDEVNITPESEIVEQTEELPEIETPTETPVGETAQIPEESIIEEVIDENRDSEIEIGAPEKKPTKEKPIPEKIDTSKVEKLTNLISSIKTLIARGMMTEAQALIIEGLSLEKNNRDLNLLLGSIYEHNGQFEKAEYVYKDLAELDHNDIEILEKLANVLIIERKYAIANEIYKKIHSFTGNTETTLYMLSHISNTLLDYEATLIYSKQYVLQWPKNPEIITLLAQAQIQLGHRRDAIDTYKHLKNLTPYSSEISETLQKLLLEEELANNFQGKQ